MSFTALTNIELVQLPDVNGIYEAGIALSTDQALPDDHKLKVFPPGEGNNAKRYRALASALAAYRNTTWGSSACRPIYVAAACACVHFGLLGQYNSGGQTVHDGDYIIMASACEAFEPEEWTAIRGMVNEKNIQQALTIICATKVNWWLVNHHTGSNREESSGYTAKTLNAIVKQNNREWTTCALEYAHLYCAHTIGHWASTIGILRKAGITNLRPDYTRYVEPDHEWSSAVDAKMRFDSLPAGVHKIALCFEMAKRLASNVMLKFWSDPTPLINLGTQIANLQAAGAKAHIGASYLTGQPQVDRYIDSADQMIGRLVTFIRIFYQSATLLRSPHLQASALTSVPDYSSAWEATCGKVLRHQQESLQNIDNLIPQMAQKTGEKIVKEDQNSNISRFM